MIERAQPITKQDIGLVKRILNENDEVVIGIGAAGDSHEKRDLMTAGERIDIIDYTFMRNEIDPNRYILVPIENKSDATSWVSEVMTMTPRWDTFYTRNFKNATMFKSFQRQFGYDIEMVEEQKPEKDYFELWADALNGSRLAFNELRLYVPDSTLQRMDALDIEKRIDIIYNRRKVEETPVVGNRALFLGRMQPFTGVYSQNNGHMGNIKRILEERDEAVIAIGSAQESHTARDPLTAGKRIDVIRHALLANGVPASRFNIIPINDIPSNAAYAAKIVSLCPSFNAVIAGNDWTKQHFAEGNYGVIPVERNTDRTGEKISASRVRKITQDAIRERTQKGEEIDASTEREIARRLEDTLIDPATMRMLEQVGYNDLMGFLAFAKQ